MKNHFSKKWLITFSIISIVTIAIGIALACAGDDLYVWHSSNFSPDANIDKGYTPFFALIRRKHQRSGETLRLLYKKKCE